MVSPALSRLEAVLAARKLDATLARPASPEALAPTGIAALDRALGGGWCKGEVSELVGGPTSGRTSVIVATLAAATARGEVVALVDVVDRFDPVSAAASGLDLTRVLWVRGPAMSPPGRPALVALALRQAVRSLDLVVRAGGFGVVVLDAAGVPSRAFGELAASTWLRLAHANAGRSSVCLLMGDAPVGRSARGVSVRLTSVGEWTGASLQSRRLAALAVRATIEQAQRTRGAAPGWTLRAAG
jgi:RecA/RadA recombinase